MEADVQILEGEGIRLYIIFRRGGSQVGIVESMANGGKTKTGNRLKIGSDGIVLEPENF